MSLRAWEVFICANKLFEITEQIVKFAQKIEQEVLIQAPKFIYGVLMTIGEQRLDLQNRITIKIY